ncbi:hypothetical protein TcWFU_002219 [Taenia crassiceps]|uniref:Uncharacterized protein n=1 Tax=Taenia crassiceps TaxID=6207 RepID=A0ABR4Q1I6_9CEST
MFDKYAERCNVAWIYPAFIATRVSLSSFPKAFLKRLIDSLRSSIANVPGEWITSPGVGLTTLEQLCLLIG